MKFKKRISSNVEMHREEMRAIGRADEGMLIKSVTHDHRNGSMTRRSTCMVHVRDGPYQGFYAEGGLSLPKELIVAVRKQFGVPIGVPSYFVDNKWFSYDKLKASFDTQGYVEFDSRDWSVLEYDPGVAA